MNRKALLRSSELTRAVTQLQPRAERRAREMMLASFVDLGHMERLTVNTTQFISGRRGTGKTHLLRYMEESTNEDSESRRLAVFVDCAGLGADSVPGTIPIDSLSRRAFQEFMRRLCERLETHAESIYWQNEIPTHRSPYEERRAARSRAALDHLNSAVLQSTLTATGPSTGQQEHTQSQENQQAQKSALKATLTASDKSLVGPEVSWEQSRGRETTLTRHEHIKVPVRVSIKKVDIAQALTEFLDANEVEEAYLLLDEWSDQTPELQARLAEYIKRSLLVDTRVSLKIAVLPFRRKFSVTIGTQLVGLQRNADIFLGIDLDDDLVYTKNIERTRTLFPALLKRHLLASVGASIALKGSLAPIPPDEMFDLFCTDAAQIKLMGYAQGNVRDFLELFRRSHAAHRQEVRGDSSRKISSLQVRTAAKAIGLEKIAGIDGDPSEELFDRIRRFVLHEKKQNAFMVKTTHATDRNLQFLVHNRIIHVWDKDFAAPRHPGDRFHIFAIDYCVIIENFRANQYRHIDNEITLPFNPKNFTEEFAAKLREDAKMVADHERRRELTQPSKPDKRRIRYTILPDSFFALSKAAQCRHCGNIFDINHPVAKRHGLCPNCGEIDPLGSLTGPTD